MEKKYEDGYKEGYTNAILDLTLELTKETNHFTNKQISVKKVSKITKRLVDSARVQIKKDLIVK